MVQSISVIRGFVFASVLFALTLSGSAQVMRTETYQSTSSDFANPDRGFYRFRDLTAPSNFQGVRADDHTLIYGRIPAKSFRNSPLSQSFLDDIQNGFDQARIHGIKVKPRVLYNDGPNDAGGEDAPKSVILGHIQQLQPLFEANKDVIYLMDAGFIGIWGEWHTSSNGLDNNTDRSDILAALLDALPSDRMVGVRTPHFKREIYNGSPIDDTLKITSANAFDESDLARVGHLNDCFLASSSDFGTYIHQASGWDRAAELNYIGGESRYGPHGGETCAQSSYSTGANAINEMEILHTDYLNYDYNQTVHQDWQNDGVFDEISRRLGYRYEMQTAELPQAVRPSGVIELNVDIDNLGFGELFNPRTVEVVLTNNSTGDTQNAALSLDPRYWAGGTSNSIQTFLTVPAGTPEGNYSVGLWLPDAEASLRDDVRYAIRFANANVWDATTGINILANNLQVLHSAQGPVYTNLSDFAEVLDPSQLQQTISADFDRDGTVDGIDIDALVFEISTASQDPLFDLTGDGTVNGADLLAWLNDAGNLNLGPGLSYLFGDANLDGAVNGADFIIWNTNKFTTIPAWTAGDFDASGVVNGADFIVWNTYKFTSSDGVAAVPEPSGIVLMGCCLLLFLQRAGKH